MQASVLCHMTYQIVFSSSIYIQPHLKIWTISSVGLNHQETKKEVCLLEKRCTLLQKNPQYLEMLCTHFCLPVNITQHRKKQHYNETGDHVHTPCGHDDPCLDKTLWDSHDIWLCCISMWNPQRVMESIKYIFYNNPCERGWTYFTSLSVSLESQVESLELLPVRQIKEMCPLQ